MHPPCGALRCPLIVCDEHQRMPRPMQSVKQLQHAVCCGRIQSCGRLIRQNHARFCHDRPCEYNRLVPRPCFERETHEVYALGEIDTREAILLFNDRTRLTAENTIEYMI